MRGRGLPTLLVDGGDIFFGVPTIKAPTRSAESRAMSKARRIVKAYAYMGYDVLGLGPSDLQFGVEKLQGLLAPSNIPVVCSNLVEKKTGKTVFEESTVVTIGGVRFGVFGVVLSSLSESYKNRITAGKYDLLDALEVSKKIVPELRKRCDFIISLSHVNQDDNEAILEAVPGIDAIVDPYSRSGNQPVWITEGEYVKWVAQRPLLRIDGQGSRVGVCELTFPRSGDPETDYYVYDYALEPQIIDHPDMSKIVSGTFLSRQSKLDPKKAALLVDLFLGAETCGACHEAQEQFWASTKHKTANDTLVTTQDHFKYESVECHTLGYGVSFVDPRKAEGFEGVQCESCHGINHRHADDPARYRIGEVKDSKCWGCHNPQVLEKPFDINDLKSKVSCPRME